jgi:hypothetical protein
MPVWPCTRPPLSPPASVPSLRPCVPTGLCLLANSSLVALCGGGTANRTDVCVANGGAVDPSLCGLPASGTVAVPCGLTRCPDAAAPVWQLEDFGACSAAGTGGAGCGQGPSGVVLGVRTRNTSCLQVWGVYGMLFFLARGANTPQTPNKWGWWVGGLVEWAAAAGLRMYVCVGFPLGFGKGFDRTVVMVALNLPLVPLPPQPAQLTPTTPASCARVPGDAPPTQAACTLGGACPTPRCPNDCSHRGSCVNGTTCVCNQGYSGTRVRACVCALSGVVAANPSACSGVWSQCCCSLAKRCSSRGMLYWVSSPRVCVLVGWAGWVLGGGEDGARAANMCVRVCRVRGCVPQGTTASATRRAGPAPGSSTECWTAVARACLRDPVTPSVCWRMTSTSRWVGVGGCG